MTRCQVMKSLHWIYTYVTVIAMRESMSISANVWYRSLKFITCLEHEYAQVAMDLFCKNVILIRCSVVVCNCILPFFLYLKDSCNLPCYLMNSQFTKASAFSTTVGYRSSDTPLIEKRGQQPSESSYNIFKS